MPRTLFGNPLDDEDVLLPPLDDDLMALLLGDPLTFSADELPEQDLPSSTETDSAFALGLAPYSEIVDELGTQIEGGERVDRFAGVPYVPQPGIMPSQEYLQQFPSLIDRQDLLRQTFGGDVLAQAPPAVPAPAPPAGIPPEAQQPANMPAGILDTAGTALGGIFDALSRPSRASAALADNLLKVVRGEAQLDVVGAFSRGLTGASTITYADVLHSAGLQNDTAAGVAGFLLDVVLDPTTYVGFGAARAAGATGAKTALRLGALGREAEVPAVSIGHAAASITGALAGGLTAPEDATPEERAARIAGGAVAGAAFGVVKPRLDPAIRFIGDFPPFHAARSALGEMFVPLYQVAQEAPDVANKLATALRVSRSSGTQQAMIVEGLLRGADPEDVRNLGHYHEGTMPVPPRFAEPMREIGKLLDDVERAEIDAGLAIPVQEQADINLLRSQMGQMAKQVFALEREGDALRARPPAPQNKARLQEITAKLSAAQEMTREFSASIKGIKDRFPGVRESVLDTPYFPHEWVAGETLDPTKRPTVGKMVSEDMRQEAARILGDQQAVEKLTDQQVLSVLADAHRVNYDQRRVFQTISQGIAAGYTPQRPDIALSRRLATSQEEIVFKDFFDDLKSRNVAVLVADDAPGGMRSLADEGRVIPPGGRSLPEGYTRVDARVLGELKDYALPTGMARDLETTFRALRTPGGLNPLLSALDQVTGFWKASVTSLFPAFHVRNEVSNIFLNWLAGVKNVNRYAEAKKLVSTGSIAVRGQTHRLSDFAEVLHSGFIGSDMLETTADVIAGGSTQRRWATLWDATASTLDRAKAGGALVPTAGRAVGSFLEDNAKLALVIDRLHKGDTPGQAMAMARKYLFDYREMTTFEQKVMKRMVPFYSWTRNVVPLMLEQMVKQPGKFAAVQKGFHNLPDIFDSQQMSEADLALLPIWMREQLGVQIGRDENGDPRLLSSLGLPIEDLNLLFTRSPKRTIEKWAGMLNPYVGTLLQLRANTSFFTGQSIDNPSYANYYRKAAPALGEIATNFPAVRDWLGLRQRETTNPATGEKRLLWVADNPQAMFIFLALPWSRFYTTVAQATREDRDVTQRVARMVTGAYVREAELGRPAFTMAGVDSDRIKQETAGALEEAAKRYLGALQSNDPTAVLNAGQMYSEARRQIFAQKTGKLAEVERARIENEGLRESGPNALRQDLRRQFASQEIRGLEDYYSLSPFDFPDTKGFLRARDAALAALGPVQRKLVEEQRDTFFTSLPPVAQKVERERAKTIEQYREFQRLRRDDLGRLMRFQGYNATLGEEAETRFRQYDAQLRSMPRNTPMDEIKVEIEKERMYRQQPGYWAWVKATSAYNRDKEQRSKRYRAERPQLQWFGLVS